MSNLPFPVDPTTAQDLQRVRQTTKSLDQLLGLYLLPPGLAITLIGAANALPSRGWNHWFIIGAVILGPIAWLAVRRYYLNVVGSVVRRGNKEEIKQGMLGAGLILAGSLLDGLLDSPVSLPAVALAVAFYLNLIPCGRYRPQFVASLLIASVAAGRVFWGASTAGGLAVMVMGLAFIAAGVAAHSRLDEALESVGARKP